MPCLVFERLNSVDDDNRNLSQEIVTIVQQKPPNKKN